MEGNKGVHEKSQDRLVRSLEKMGKKREGKVERT